MQYFTADLQTSKNQLRQIFGHFIIVKFEKRKTYNSWSKNENDCLPYHVSIGSCEI